MIRRAWLRRRYARVWHTPSVCRPLWPQDLGARRTSVRAYREILRNTLCDTPSGYMQDPRAAPARMVSYTRLTESAEAVFEAARQEEEMLSREELAYQGYTSVEVDKAKSRLLEANNTPDTLASIAHTLEQELARLVLLVGHTVTKPLTENQRELRAWRQERERLEAREKNAFVVEDNGGRAAAVDENAQVDVVVDPVDGSERIVQRVVDPSRRPAARARFVPPDAPSKLAQRDESSSHVISTDDVHLQAQPQVTHGDEDLGEELPEVEVTLADVHHVRYLLGLTYQQLGRVEAMEAHLYAILAEDPHAVDAMQCLLEVYTGMDTTQRVGDLIDFLERAETNTHLTGGTTNAEKQSASATTALSTSTEEEPPSRLSAPEVVIALLAELLTEKAALYCRDHGEGATSRFFLQALGPLARCLGPRRTSTLLEALFQSFDAQHFVARAESDEPAMAASRELIYSVVIAFLKTLVSRDMAELVRDPLRFEFFTLSKLQAALRSAGGGSRRQESYRVCERMLRLYRAHSSLHVQRIARAKAAHATEEPVLTATTNLPAAVETRVVATPPPEEAVSAAATAPGALDDQDDNYRAAYLTYVRDRAKDSSAAVGRALCLRAMEEFPDAAEPWEVLALLLHREDPKGNLKDAIVAAQRARELDPFNLAVILTLANFYKADGRVVLYETMLERFRLLSYMMENGASREDMLATIQEIADLDEQMPRANEPDLVEEASRPMKEFNERYDMHTTYSMPINKEERHFGAQPAKHPVQTPGMAHELLRGEPQTR